MWSLSTNHQLETTDKKRTRSIARRVLRGENLVGLPAGADLPTLSGRRLTRPQHERAHHPRQFKSSYPPKGSLAEAGHHSAASQLTIEKLFVTITDSNRGFRAENPVCSPPHSTLQAPAVCFQDLSHQLCTPTSLGRRIAVPGSAGCGFHWCGLTPLSNIIRSLLLSIGLESILHNVVHPCDVVGGNPTIQCAARSRRYRYFTSCTTLCTTCCGAPPRSRSC